MENRGDISLTDRKQAATLRCRHRLPGAMHRLLPMFLLFLTAGSSLMAQRRFRGGWGGESYIQDNARTAREVPSHSTGTPVWINPRGFEKDVFTFTRVKRQSAYDGDGGPWTTDAPDSDLNLSYRLQQMTSLKVDPD